MLPRIALVFSLVVSAVSAITAKQCERRGFRYKLCDGKCVNIYNDKNNCGLCGNPCGFCSSCKQGNCGSDGTAPPKSCRPGKRILKGKCYNVKCNVLTDGKVIPGPGPMGPQIGGLNINDCATQCSQMPGCEAANISGPPCDGRYNCVFFSSVTDQYAYEGEDTAVLATGCR